MKVIDTTPRPWRETLRIRALKIDSEQLTDFIQRHSEDSDEIVLSFKSGRRERTELQGIDEIRKHLASIRVPFSLQFPYFSISFERDNGAKFEFKSENRRNAETAYLELNQFKPWYAFFKNWLVYTSTFAFIVIGGYTNYIHNALESIGFGEAAQKAFVGIGMLIVLPVAIGNALLLRFSVRYKHRVNKSFFEKHGHELIIAIVTAVISIALTLLVNSYFGS
ncbi:hypothetical protein K1T73_04850 [Roseovarius sp. SCSIO 43702]|uniref:hypothetical protein n=1 Tax=Roseovarius sp. SCSIO 43702 TaxID=2823043 RepID=UPI001C72EC36|nr:hypothetical protein [Roseovarius sp. SCSIO 43702]QYX57721.1 hypothetical protein K1T73_04850 [Roseovarius sp. SCSIO 43702]